MDPRTIVGRSRGSSPATQRANAMRNAATPASARATPPIVEHHVERHASALGFIRSLKAIGAQTAARRHRPLPPAALRRVMRRFEESGSAISYEVVTCHYQRL